MIDLYTAATPNGFKISIMLEETKLPYKLHAFNLRNNDQKSPEFSRINPNGKIPAIVDNDVIHDGQPLSVFESGAILIYLANKTNSLLAPIGTSEYYATLEWIMFQMSGLGPMAGQLYYFKNYAPEKIPYAIERYENEVKRLLGVLDEQLAKREYIAGNYSIADISIYPWLVGMKKLESNLISDKKNVEAYIARIAERPAVQKGMQIPPPQS